ncbi:hypothetical protein L1887_29359 [Cichorium endivia]|nr:hypothetical protein L1887_29359 [Cichorium endivia]
MIVGVKVSRQKIRNGFDAFLLFYTNSQYGFVSSSSISNESSLRLNPEITLDMTPPGFTGISRYRFTSSSSIPHDEKSNSYLDKEDSSKTQLAF